MDVLDRVAGPGRDLLSRVDSVLAAGGAPADHPVWPLLRRVGALPGDVLDAFCALVPEQVTAAGAAVRGRAEAYVDERADLAAAVAATTWEGDSAAAFGQRWTALGGHLGSEVAPDAPGLAGRLAATASYLDDVAGWMRSARRDLATEVATALGSMEAVRVRAPATGGPGDPARSGPAAATIGAVVLAVADRQAGAAEEVLERWAGRLTDLPYRPSTDPVGRTGTATRAAV
ncbi:hypothetical protein [Virgisporangium aurantiacum]|uniref:Uncharacterized protein n=1 Tax=Virgisporangium aurantiacum TaxID=175570 RepID=A0A8J3Z292_9ACTN|nr:hypothetical protein [Virgisporangium aurantiacum]GIJ53825.1 hypothetical protein Vau01_013410 [Virgisporangium aurantiacum]